jgi:hypothetical protein
MPNSKPQTDDTTGDPDPLRGGVCDEHGEFNNFSGRCLACIPAGELLRRPGGDA